MPIATRHTTCKSTKQSQENEAMQDKTIKHVDDGADVEEQLEAAAVENGDATPNADEAVSEPGNESVGPVEVEHKQTRAKRGSKKGGKDKPEVKGDEKFLDAIASFEAANRVENTAWSEFVRVIAQRNFADAAEFNTFCKGQEAIFKTEYNWKGAMPAKYRSAKSEVLKAMNAGVSLIDQDGNPVPKTALRKAANDAEKIAHPPVEKSSYDLFKELINKAHNRFAELDGQEQKLALQTIKNLFQGVCK